MINPKVKPQGVLNFGIKRYSSKTDKMDHRLTRKLYRVGEACCMFRLALSRGKQQDALFWADELFSSGCLPQLNQILFEVWLFYKGLSDCNWLIIWYGSDHDYNDALCNTVRLCWSIRDGKDIRVLLETMCPGPTPNTKAASKAKLRTSPRDKVFRILGRLAASNSMTSAIGAFWRLANSGGVETMKMRPYRDIETADVEFSPTPLAVQRPWLYGLCERGEMGEDETTICEIRGNIIDRLRVQGCPYWSNALVAVLTGYNAVDGYDEEAVEEFLQKHFPKDIPDEWSLSAQMRTHGQGVLFETESAASVVKLLRLLFPACDELTAYYGVIGDKKIPYGATTLFDVLACFSPLQPHPASSLEVALSGLNLGT